MSDIRAREGAVGVYNVYRVEVESGVEVETPIGLVEQRRPGVWTCHPDAGIAETFGPRAFTTQPTATYRTRAEALAWFAASAPREASRRPWPKNGHAINMQSRRCSKCGLSLDEALPEECAGPPPAPRPFPMDPLDPAKVQRAFNDAARGEPVQFTVTNPPPVNRSSLEADAVRLLALFPRSHAPGCKVAVASADSRYPITLTDAGKRRGPRTLTARCVCGAVVEATATTKGRAVGCTCIPAAPRCPSCERLATAAIRACPCKPRDACETCRGLLCARGDVLDEYAAIVGARRADAPRSRTPTCNACGSSDAFSGFSLSRCTACSRPPRSTGVARIPPGTRLYADGKPVADGEIIPAGARLSLGPA